MLKREIWYTEHVKMIVMTINLHVCEWYNKTFKIAAKSKIPRIVKQ